MYKYVKVDGKVVNRNIPEESQINTKVVRRIRKKYSQDDENKYNNLREQANGWEEFNRYLEECRAWGASEKAQADIDKEVWKDFQWDINAETREEFIFRIEQEGLI